MKTKRRRPALSRQKKRTTRVTIDFPAASHKKLKALAALEGVTVQEYIRSRVCVEDDMSDAELKSLTKKIIEENKDALKRLAHK